jgi:hypothetical protein
VGTGFSIGAVTATNETDAAKDFNNFFLNFLQTFGIKNFKIFLIGKIIQGDMYRTAHLLCLIGKVQSISMDQAFRFYE